MKQSSCVYLIDDNRRWLMLYRNRKENDVNHGKYIGVGGKRKDGETMEQCAIRETFEETGYSITHLQYNGIIFFHYPDHAQEEIYVYSSQNWTGSQTPCDEGTLVWVKQEEILDLNLWEGDRIFLKQMLDHPEPFQYEFFYDENDQLVQSILK